MAPSAISPLQHDIGSVSLSKSNLDTPIYDDDTVRGWPAHLASALAWSGSDFASEDQFVYELSNQDKAEIEDALAHFKSNSTFSFIDL